MYTLHRSSYRTGMTPTDMYDAYCSHRNSARRRGIAFEFTLEQWCAWWRFDNRWANRGRKRDQYVMARRGDTGPYSMANVYLATQGQNQRDRTSESYRLAAAKAAATRKANPSSYQYDHLRSDVHPRRVAVVTPAGRFVSVKAAAEHHGLTLSAMNYRLKTLPGWDRA